jgi:hypothetical protein
MWCRARDSGRTGDVHCQPSGSPPDVPCMMVVLARPPGPPRLSGARRGRPQQSFRRQADRTRTARSRPARGAGRLSTAALRSSRSSPCSSACPTTNPSGLVGKGSVHGQIATSGQAGLIRRSSTTIRKGHLSPTFPRSVLQQDVLAHSLLESRRRPGPPARPSPAARRRPRAGSSPTATRAARRLSGSHPGDAWAAWSLLLPCQGSVVAVDGQHPRLASY